VAVGGRDLGQFERGKAEVRCVVENGDFAVDCPEKRRAEAIRAAAGRYSMAGDSLAALGAEESRAEFLVLECA